MTPPPKPSTTKSPRLLPKDITRQQGAPSSDLANIRILADRGEIERAGAQCHQLLKTHKLNPTCHLYHALIIEQLDQHSSCEQSLRRAIYLDRNFVLAHYYLGLTLQRLGRQGEAARSSRNARQLLATLDRDRVIEDADGLTVAELDDIARMQLDAIET